MDCCGRGNKPSVFIALNSYRRLSSAAAWIYFISHVVTLGIPRLLLPSLREHNQLLFSGITNVEAAGESLSQKCHCASVLCGSRCLHNGGSTCMIVHSSVQYTVGMNRNIIVRYCGLYEDVLFFGHS